MIKKIIITLMIKKIIITLFEEGAVTQKLETLRLILESILALEEIGWN